MEVYNFVGCQTKRKRFSNLNFKLPSLENKFSSVSIPTRKNRRKENAAIIAVPKIFSVRSFFIYIGSGITSAGEIIKTHKKAVGITVLAIILGIIVCISSYKICSYHKNHTSPLVLSELQESEIARLDKMMADFAMDNYSEVTETGDIKNAVAASAALFSQPVSYQTYKVQKGDSVSTIAKKFGLSNISTLISVNDIGNARALAAGQKLKIPSIDGILYTVKSGDSINSVAAKNGISVDAILDVNDLSTETLHVGQSLFLPGAKLDQKTLSLAMGDQFICPIKTAYRFSSKFGWRDDPISGKRSYHKGDDLACPTGTPIYASLSGKVIYVGESWLYGKHIIIDHENGYQTLYAHCSKLNAAKGQWVNQGTKIGLVGSTGYSTGPHLHFTVYKKGSPIAPSSVVKYE